MADREKLILGNKMLSETGKHGSLQEIKKLVDAGADVNFERGLAIRNASAYGRTDIVEYLIQCGADLHTGDYGAFRIAIQNGHLETLKMILNYLPPSHSQLPGHYFVRRDFPEVGRMLTDYGYTPKYERTSPGHVSVNIRRIRIGST